MSSVLRDLPEPNFIDRDAQKIVSELIAEYGQLTGKTLYPAQIERLWINLIAYRESQVRIGIQEAAKQNLVRYASKPILDYLGEPLGVYRLDPQPATTTLRFTLDESLETGFLIPAGTQVEDTSGTVTFATDIDLTLQVGQLSTDVSATCEETGEIGNGWQPGQISVFVDGFDIDLSVSNIAVTTNGFDEEDDERLRERIMLAPESFSTAGPKAAYIYWAKSTHQSIIDVAVMRPKPGSVALYLLTEDGLADENLCKQVYSVCSDEERRPLCDTVIVKSTEKINYSIDAILVPYVGINAESVKAEAATSIAAFAKNIRSKQGRDVVLDQLKNALLVPGIKKVILNEPLTDLAVEINETAFCQSVTIEVGEAEDE